MNRIPQRLLDLFAIRRDELARTLLAFCYLFLIICSYLLIKAIRNSLFISEFGAMKLPYVMLGIAGLAGLFASAYIRLARRVRLSTLLVGSLVFFSLNVVLFWWFALAEHGWLYPVIYLWSGVFGVIAPTQVWSLANELFTTRESKRLFGVIGAGGILGAVVGGSAAGRLATTVGTTHLLLVVAGLIAVAALVAGLLCRQRLPVSDVTTQIKRPRNLTQALKLIFRTRHLRLLAGLIFITALATTSADFQFNVMAADAFDTKDQLTAFFGLVYGSLSLIAFVVQLLLTSRVLRHFGVGLSIMLLPASMFIGTLALFGSGALWAAIFLKGSDGTLKHSIDRSSRELMYLPLPARIKWQAKSTIDTVMDRMGDGSAGALQLLITGVLGLGLKGSLAANFAVIGVWLVWAAKAKVEYVNQLRGALGRKPPRLFSDPAFDWDADSCHAAVEVLREGSESERLGVLEWMATHGVRIDEAVLVALAREDPSPTVRRAALAVLVGGEEDEAAEAQLESLEEEGRGALVAAIDMLVLSTPEQVRARLDELVDASGGGTKLSLVAFMLRRLGPEFAPFAGRILDALLDPALPSDARVESVRNLTLLPPRSELLDRLTQLLDDPDPAVAAAAAEVAGRLKREDMLPRMISLLAHPRARPGARRGIEMLGGDAVGPLNEALDDTQLDLDVRRWIPDLIARSGGQRAMGDLAERIDDEEPLLAERCLEALYRARQRYPMVKPLEPRQLEACVVREFDAFDRLVAIEAALSGQSGDAAVRWMLEAIAAERARVMKRVFRTLALEYSVADMHQAWLAVRDGAPTVRANAVELLDNVLQRELKRGLLPLLDHALKSKGSAQRTALTRDQALLELARWPHAWVAACALFVGRRLGVAALAEAARAGLESGEPALREEAQAFVDADLGEAGA